MVEVARRLGSEAVVSILEKLVPFTEHQGTGGAGGYASRFQTNVDTLGAHGTFIDEGSINQTFVVVKVGHAKGAGIHAIAAADAFFGVVNDRTIRALAVGTHRAGRQAVRFIAMHAVVDHGGAFKGWKLALQPDPGNPDAGLVHGNLIFDATGNHAGAAVDAARGVKKECFVLNIRHETAPD